MLCTTGACARYRSANPIRRMSQGNDHCDRSRTTCHYHPKPSRSTAGPERFKSLREQLQDGGHGGMVSRGPAIPEPCETLQPQLLNGSQGDMKSTHQRHKRPACTEQSTEVESRSTDVGGCLVCFEDLKKDDNRVRCGRCSCSIHILCFLKWGRIMCDSHQTPSCVACRHEMLE
jgi:hypothetical protein